MTAQASTVAPPTQGHIVATDTRQDAAPEDAWEKCLRTLRMEEVPSGDPNILLLKYEVGRIFPNQMATPLSKWGWAHPSFAEAVRQTVLESLPAIGPVHVFDDATLESASMIDAQGNVRIIDLTHRTLQVSKGHPIVIAFQRCGST